MTGAVGEGVVNLFTNALRSFQQIRMATGRYVCDTAIDRTLLDAPTRKDDCDEANHAT